MNLFFKRRSIKKLSGVFSLRLTGVALLKLVLLFIMLGTTVYFKVWAERRQGSPSFPSPSTSLRKSAKETASFLSSGGSFPLQEEIFPGAIDINTASSEELQSLPGIGPKLAEEIVQDRIRKGPFLQGNDLLRVKGIGPQKARSIEPHLRFKG